MSQTPERNTRRTQQGTVVSNKAAKTITVAVERTYKHPKYGKYVRRRRKFLAHDPDSTAQVGDVVEIGSTRPLSARKRWRLVRVLQRGDLVEVSSAETGGTGRPEPAPEPAEAEGDQR
jgi:small subunit ribosomal protein S17